MVFITDMVGMTADERDMLAVADTVELVAFVVTVDVVAPTAEIDGVAATVDVIVIKNLLTDVTASCVPL